MITRQNNNGVRPDLAKLPVNWPDKYIGAEIFPPSTTAEMTGEFTYRGIVADASAEVDRAANVNLTMNLITNEDGEFTCHKYEKRHGMTEKEVKQIGGIEKADPIGARASKRVVIRAFENAAKAKVFSAARKSAALSLTAGKELAIINAAADQVRRVSGVLSLVASRQWLLGFIGLQYVQARLVAIGGLQGYITSRDAALGIQPEVLVSMLRTVLPFERILVGDNDHWFSHAEANYAAVMMLPSVKGEDILPAAKEDPIYGLSKWFLPDPVGAPDSMFEVSSDWLPTEKISAWDATGYFDLIELNPTGAQLVELPSGAVYSTTSTTTTSTSTTSTSTTTTTTTAG
jgi:hypothetical protein